MSHVFTDEAIRLNSSNLPYQPIDVCVMVDGLEIIVSSSKRRWRVRGFAAENVEMEFTIPGVILRWKFKHTYYEIFLTRQDALPRTFLPGPLLEALGLITSLKSIEAA